MWLQVWALLCMCWVVAWVICKWIYYCESFLIVCVIYLKTVYANILRFTIKNGEEMKERRDGHF